MCFYCELELFRPRQLLPNSCYTNGFYHYNIELTHPQSKLLVAPAGSTRTTLTVSRHGDR